MSGKYDPVKAKKYREDHAQAMTEKSARYRKSHILTKRNGDAKYREEHRTELRERRKKHHSTLNSRFYHAKITAKRRQKTWELTLEQYSNLVAEPCFYCSNRLGPPSILGIGLDRLDNNMGYLPGNIVSCCGICNSIKGKFSSEEAKVMIEALLKFRSI